MPWPSKLFVHTVQPHSQTNLLAIFKLSKDWHAYDGQGAVVTTCRGLIAILADTNQRFYVPYGASQPTFATRRVWGRGPRRFVSI